MTYRGFAIGLLRYLAQITRTISSSNNFLYRRAKYNLASQKLRSLSRRVFCNYLRHADAIFSKIVLRVRVYHQNSLMFVKTTFQDILMSGTGLARKSHVVATVRFTTESESGHMAIILHAVPVKNLRIERCAYLCMKR
jgi:hypothetical protein